MNAPKQTIHTLARDLAGEYRAEALARGDAVLVGDLSGMIEWTGEAWTRLTGFPLAETLDKPITHFLERAGLELELVEFVAHNFLAGRPATVELAFQTFDQRAIHIHLEVEPLRDEAGEISRFIAVASDITQRKSEQAAVPALALSSQATATEAALPSRVALEARSRARTGPLASFSLRAAASRAARKAIALSGDRANFDLALDPALPKVEGDPDRFDELMDSLLGAALADLDPNSGFVTLLTGTLEPGRSHVSQAYPIPARSIERTAEPRLYVEIHDTSPALDREALERIERADRPRGAREDELHRARALAAEFGAAFHYDSTPGCGNQSLLILPRPAERSSR